MLKTIVAISAKLLSSLELKCFVRMKNAINLIEQLHMPNYKDLKQLLENLVKEMQAVRAQGEGK